MRVDLGMCDATNIRTHAISVDARLQELECEVGFFFSRVGIAAAIDGGMER